MVQFATWNLDINSKLMSAPQKYYLKSRCPKYKAINFERCGYMLLLCCVLVFSVRPLFSLHVLFIIHNILRFFPCSSSLPLFVFFVSFRPQMMMPPSEMKSGTLSGVYNFIWPHSTAAWDFFSLSSALKWVFTQTDRLRNLWERRWREITKQHFQDVILSSSN